MRVGLIVALVALGACKNEQDFVPDDVQPGIGEPPLPENPLRVDRIVQVSEPAVDVVFVIDNSCSMEEEQVLLAQNFPAFLQYFLTSGLNYHIGVVSTDMEHPFHTGKLQDAGGIRYLDRDTVNPGQIFAQMVQLGIGGWFEERGRDALFTLIDIRRDAPENEGFYRPNASLHAIFVSDENDQSVLITRNEFDQWGDALKWSPEMVTLHAIVAPNLAGPCAAAFEVGLDYQHYAVYTGGSQFSICESDWGPMLDTLGVQASGLRREYFLTRIPVPDSIQVRVEVTPEGGGDPVELEFVVCQPGEEVDDDTCQVTYLPTRNSIVFLDYVPDPLSEVIVSYYVLEDYSADPGIVDDL